MEIEYDTQSWKDRCNRYFSSISDTEKDRDQEKNHRNGDHQLNNSDEVQRNQDNEDTWRDLSALQTKFKEHFVLRYVRKTLSVLDIHGAKLGDKTRSTVELIIWIVIICAAVGVVVFLVWLQVMQYKHRSSKFETVGIITPPYADDTATLPVISVCNLNLMRKSALLGSNFESLIDIEKGISVSVNTLNPVATVDEVFEANARLKEFIEATNDISALELIKQIKEDRAVIEMTTQSNVSLGYRLSRYEDTDILREVIQPSLSDIEVIGHKIEDMLIDCWNGRRNCRQSEIKTASYTELGNCVTISPASSTEYVQLTLNAEVDEYINVLSPSAGFIISIHDADIEPGHGRTAIVVPNQHTRLKLTKERTTTRLEGTCNHSSFAKEACLASCLYNTQQRVCGCSQKPADSTHMFCNHQNVSQYVCIKAIALLERKGKLGCSCEENCIDKENEFAETKTEWPSQANMQRVQSYFLQKNRQLNESQIRENIAKVTVHLVPDTRETRQEVEVFTLNPILDLLSRIGGLSALVAGISLVTLLELIWTLARLTFDIVMYYNNSSTKPTDMHRLSDSEITSITWAMYRQKRNHEEMDKNQHKDSRKKGQTVLGGNVQSRIAKRNNYLPPVTEDGNTDECDDVYKERHNDNISEQQSQNQRARNGYRRNYDNGRRSGSYSENKAMFKVMDSPHDGIHMVSRPHTPDNKAHDGQTRHQQHGDETSRYASEHLSRSSGLYQERGRLVTPANAIQLYGGYSAYFHANNISEPMYL